VPPAHPLSRSEVVPGRQFWTRLGVPRLLTVQAINFDGIDLEVDYRVAQGPGKGKQGRVPIEEFLQRVRP
jgi:hypothetical protein